MKNDEVRAATEKRLRAYAVTAAEATALMGGWAHGSLNPFLSETGHLDLTTPQAQANLHLIKKIIRSQTKYGESVEIELAPKAPIPLRPATPTAPGCPVPPAPRQLPVLAHSQQYRRARR